MLIFQLEFKAPSVTGQTISEFPEESTKAQRITNQIQTEIWP